MGRLPRHLLLIEPRRPLHLEESQGADGEISRAPKQAVYNLSVSGEGHQQQYANLLLEGQRLNTREGACVLWLIFAGNDLDELDYPELETPSPRAWGCLLGLLPV